MTKECWASIFNPRVITYQETHNLPIQGTKMAVVVQEMVNADKSGVAFSKNPVEEKKEVLIEAAFGLGESVVSGSITPDEYRVNRKNKEITKKEVNQQATYHTKEGTETVEKEMPEEKQTEQVLSEKKIKKIAKQALGIEEHYNQPQDVEWSIDNNRLYILQTRPITA